MLNLSIAWRNVCRNRRRTGITTTTIALGAAALLLLGALMNYVVLEFQTSTVRRSGHVAVFQSGYLLYGAGSPAAYGIRDYAALMTVIRSDPVMKPLLRVATPVQVVAGVAGNYQVGASKTFFGQGVIPTDRLGMLTWNQHELEGIEAKNSPLARIDGVAVGSGIARILHLCDSAGPGGCPRHPLVKTQPAVSSPQDEELVALSQREHASNIDDAPADAAPRIELLAATAGGAPNVMSAAVERVDAHGAKELNDNLIVMQLSTAQRLVYGRGEPRATAINIQLQRTEDVPAARAALQRLFKARGLDLEVRDFVELNSLYAQTQAFFAFLFGFVALVIGAIVLFTIMNTMSMSVMERFSEIGTARALGVQRSSVRRLFILEGALQGLFGVTVGVVLAVLIVFVVNRSGLVWSPPTSAGVLPFRLYLFGNPALIGGTWLLLIFVAALAAWLPARRASRMPIVDALRHV
ncbi:FtsX-like permease family protein [Variovorax sp. J2P1-59]|uniref:ABC transporter permease n=1 Tax=Variovorax flavidus TaxID=3053501 RepID=UPI00257839C2|nr:FtsX-like permease family protein [Variovorax sp. J2P1-59]MDM0077530.1 FtsX-like permease family protein [Variovorax sp. J2P1-59]